MAVFASAKMMEQQQQTEEEKKKTEGVRQGGLGPYSNDFFEFLR